MHFTLPRFSLFALGLVAFALPSRAQLLNAAGSAQLETWIDRGPLTFTNVFTKVAGDGQNAVDFNLAADGKGPTVSLLDVVPFDRSDGLFDLPHEIIGGGSPLAWDASNTWHLAANPDRSAFLFDFTHGTIQRENTTGADGAFQTYNSIFFGPVFGLGDLVTDFSLQHGTAFHSSYGGTSPLTPDILGNVGTVDLFKINRLEIYQVALASIPEPATYGLFMAAGLAAVVLLRRRNQPAAVQI